MSKRFLKPFEDGDDDSYSWSGRVCKGAHQFLLDLMAEENLPNKSQTIKLVVQFAWTWYVKAAQLTDHTMSERLRARLEFDASRREAEQRQDILIDLNRQQALINETDYPPMRAVLIFAGKQLAEAHNFRWPPPSMPLVSHDKDAWYVYNKILDLASESESNKVSLRDLVRRTWKRDRVMPVVEQLADEGYIEIVKECRSGPTTIWIVIPSLDVKKKVEKESSN